MASLDDYRRALLKEEAPQNSISNPTTIDPVLETYRRALLPDEDKPIPLLSQPVAPAAQEQQPAIVKQAVSKLRADMADKPRQVADVLKAIPQGATDTLLSAERIIRGVNEKVPSLAELDRRVLGITPENLNKNIEERTKSTKEFEASDLGKSTEGGLGRFVGQQGVVLPLTLGAIGALRAGASAVGPTAGTVANWLTGGGGTLSNALAGGEITAANNALTYGTSEQPFGEHVARGVPTGMFLAGASRFIPATASNLYNYGHTAIGSMTEGGQNRLADQILTRYAGESPNALTMRPYSPIPDVERTLPEAIEGGNAGVSGLYRTLMNNQDTNRMLVERAQQNTAARQTAYKDLMPYQTADDLQQAIRARSDVEGKALSDSGIFTSAKSTDAVPVISKIDDILSNSSSRKDPVVQSVLKSVKNTLIENQPANGLVQLVDDPATLYNSTRKPIDRILQSRLGPNAEPIDKTVASHLQEVKGELDKAIEHGAPGFKQALTDFAEVSKPIDQSKFLQSARTNTQDEVTLKNIDSLIKKAETLRAGSGANAAKTLSDDQMETLYSLRDDMRRATQIDLGKARGSPTVQNLLGEELLNNLSSGSASKIVGLLSRPGVAGMAAGAGIGHIVGGPYGGAVGSLAGSTVAEMLHAAMSARNEAVRQKILDRMLAPELFTPRLPAQPMANGLLPGVIGGTAASYLPQNNSLMR